MLNELAKQFPLYYDSIKKYNKGLKIKNHKVITNSWCNNIVIINNELVFRFPKISYPLANLIKEQNITNAVRNKVSITIPKLNIIKENNGYFFTVHNAIKGIDYTRLPCNFKDIIRKKLSKQLALFISELHQTEIKNNLLKKFKFDFQSAKFNIRDNEIDLIKRYSLLCNYLKDNKKINILNRTIDFIEKENERLSLDDNFIIHSDINAGNFLINPFTGNLSGVIDFTNSKFGNFNIEFSPLLSFDYKLAKMTAGEYEKITKRKTNLLYSLHIQKAIYYSYLCNRLEQNDLDNIDFLLVKLRGLDYCENKI